MIRSLALLVAACVLVGPTGLRAAGCGAGQPDSRDIVAIAPHTHKVLIDNDMVRILDVNLPGRIRATSTLAGLAGDPHRRHAKTRRALPSSQFRITLARTPGATPGGQ